MSCSFPTSFQPSSSSPDRAAVAGTSASAQASTAPPHRARVLSWRSRRPAVSGTELTVIIGDDIDSLATFSLDAEETDVASASIPGRRTVDVVDVTDGAGAVWLDEPRPAGREKRRVAIVCRRQRQLALRAVRSDHPRQ